MSVGVLRGCPRYHRHGWVASVFTVFPDLPVFPISLISQTFANLFAISCIFLAPQVLLFSPILAQYHIFLLLSYISRVPHMFAVPHILILFHICEVSHAFHYCLFPICAYIFIYSLYFQCFPHFHIFSSTSKYFPPNLFPYVHSFPCLLICFNIFTASCIFQYFPISSEYRMFSNIFPVSHISRYVPVFSQFPVFAYISTYFLSLPQLPICPYICVVSNNVFNIFQVSNISYISPISK